MNENKTQWIHNDYVLNIRILSSVGAYSDSASQFVILYGIVNKSNEPGNKIRQ